MTLTGDGTGAGATRGGEAGATDLVVLLHAYTSGPQHLSYVRTAALDALADAEFLEEQLPLGAFSFADPVEIAENIVEAVERRWQSRGRSFKRIFLVGHSLGALLARKAYVYACGETDEAPFEPQVKNRGRREWAPLVERVILLAAVNRGWSISHHVSIGHAILWSIGVGMTRALDLVRPGRPMVFAFRRGGGFVTQLRLQWLRLSQRSGGTHRMPLTVQLLGSLDDVVSPEDNIDLVSGHSFVYLDVPKSGHVNVVRMDHTPEGRARAGVFRHALTLPEADLRLLSVQPADEVDEVREDVTDVIFVMHGIRDAGYWTHKVARCVKRLGERPGPGGRRKFATETATYGYFPMLPFILPGPRRRKVAWFMDQYTEAVARYPNARFSYVGHSNGTYLLARALADYPAVRFHRVVFAGSVVRRTYDWRALRDRKQVDGVLNFVATADWVVAIFPKAFQTVRLSDLGSAGHDGFEAPVGQVRYVCGGHGAALVEDNWDTIAKFVVDGTLEPKGELLAPRQAWPVRLLGWVAPAVWAGILLGLACVAVAIWRSGWSDPTRLLALLSLAFVVWKILTRF